MKTGRTLQEVAVELARQRATTRDFRAPTQLLNYWPDGHLDIPLGGSENHEVQTNDLFLSQLATWAKIPKTYFDRMRTEAKPLLAENVNHWLRTQSETRLVRTLDGTARAFLSHRYRIIDNMDVVETVLPIFAAHGIEALSTEVTDNHLYIKGVDTKRTLEVKRGDAVQLGVVISNSEVGQGAVRVDPLVYRLVCLNGAILADTGLRKFHIGRRLEEINDSQEVFRDDTVLADNKAFFLKLRDVTNAAFDEAAMTDVLQAIEAGTRRRLTDGKFLEEVVEVTAKRYALNSTEAEGVLRQLIEGRDLTQWGLANAITAYSQQAETYERATELEKLGGTLMTLDEAGWKEVAV